MKDIKKNTHKRMERMLACCMGEPDKTLVTKIEEHTVCGNDYVEIVCPYQRTQPIFVYNNYNYAIILEGKLCLRHHYNVPKQSIFHKRQAE